MQEFSTNLGLSILPEVDQKRDPETYSELLRMRNALRALQSALDQYTGALSVDKNYWDQTPPASSVLVQNISRVYVPATEAIAFGQATHLWNNAGTLSARLANATNNTRPCRAYCNVQGGVGIGEYGEFILLGLLRVAGVTPGATYYLDTVNGLITLAAPGVVGNIVQEVGFGLDDTSIWFNPILNWYVI